MNSRSHSGLSGRSLARLGENTGLEHAFLARLLGFRARVAPVDQALADLRGGIRDGRQGRIVRQASRCGEQHLPARTHREATDGFTELPGAAVGRNGRSGGVHENRQDRDGPKIPEHRFPHLNEAMVDRHAVRHRDVETLRPHMIYEFESRLFRNVERTGPASPVTEGDRAGADAERRHQVVEEAVEVIWGELDDVVGRKLLHERSELGERRPDTLLGFVTGRSPVHEGRVGRTDYGY
jgi:hypothetical protein